MTISPDTILIILGIVVNVIVIGGVFIKLENRLTKLETILSLVAPQAGALARAKENERNFNHQ